MFVYWQKIMMQSSPEMLLERIRAYCLAKPGVSPHSDLGRLSYVIPDIMEFVREITPNENPTRLVIRCYNWVLETLSENTSVKVPKRIQWGGADWRWVDVLLDGTLSETDLFRLLDDAYQIGIAQLDETDISLIEILDRNLTMHDALDALIDSNHLQDRRGEIEALIDTSILLRTLAADETNLALGQTKIGGSPDLPQDWGYPLFDGKPVAFLAQVNLAAIPQTIRKSWLPSTGILYFFSMFGWADDAEAYWDTGWWGRFKETGFSQVLYYDGELTSLRRRTQPESETAFKAAAVEFFEVLSLPRGYYHSRDPVVAKLDWTEQEFDHLDDLYFDFGIVLSRMGLASGHKLLGYADPVHAAVTKADTQLLFEMITDDENLGKIPGNGGIIYFAIAHADLDDKNFSNVQVDFHFD